METACCGLRHVDNIKTFNPIRQVQSQDPDGIKACDKRFRGSAECRMQNAECRII